MDNTPKAAEFWPSTGQLAWRGYFRTRDMMVKQAEFFETEAEKRDWFADTAKLLARECWSAIEQYDAFHDDDNEEWRWMWETGNAERPL